MDNGCTITFEIIGKSVLRITTYGQRSEHQEPFYEELHDAIIAEAFPNDQPYIEIHDISGMGSLPSPELRRQYSQFQLSDSFRNCRGNFIYGDNLVLKTVFRVGLALRGSELHFPMKVVSNYQAAMDTSRDALKPGKLTLGEFRFDPLWKLVTPDQQGGVDLGIARGNILFLRYWGIATTELSDQLFQLNERMLEEGHLKGPRYVRIGDYTRLKSASLNTRMRYAQELHEFHDRHRQHLVLEKTLVVGAPSWVRVSMSFTTRIVAMPILHFGGLDEAFAHMDGCEKDVLGTARTNTQAVPSNLMELEDFEFRSEWKLINGDGTGGIDVGVAHFKVLLIRLWGELHDPLVAERLAPLCLQIVQQGFLIGPEYFRITDFGDLKEASLSVRRTYAQGVGQFHDHSGLLPLRTVLSAASMMVRASQIIFSHITRQPVQYVQRLDQALELAGQAIHGTLGKQALLDKEVHAVNSADLDKLVRLLGSLAWEVDGGDIRFPEDHPLHEAAEAFRLVKEDYNAVLERHREAEHKAIQASRAKSDFLANMSHEIRTPLNGVVGMIQLLSDAHLTSEQRQYADIARSSADSLLELVNDILDLSKIEAGKLDLEEVSFDLWSLLDDFASVMGARALEKGLELVSNPHLDIPRCVTGDPVRLRQILTNLVSNALKFTDEGEIVLTVNLEAEDDTELLLAFSVHDSGIGVPLEKQATIFDNFSQADTSTTRKFGGTGLGLSICRQLCQKMGGSIGVTSASDHGSVFRFTVRMRKSSLIAPPLECPQALQDVQILVVDDNAAARLVMERQLSALGMRVDTACDAISALEILQSAPTDDPFRIVIIDQRMPDIDGERLTRTIRENPAWNDLRLIMASAFGIRISPHKLHQAGLSAFLQKPVRRSELVRSLLHAVDDAPESSIGNPDSSPPAPASAPFRPSSQITILVVEDNVTNQKVALGILRKLGYRSAIANHGEEALEQLSRKDFDLILMDCQMPVMDGYETTRQIRAGLHGVLNPRIPIVAMTANALVGDRELVLEAGMDDFLTKPVSQSRLQQTLERWLFSRPKD